MSNAARQHWLSQRVFDRTPMLTTHLRSTLFAEWLRWYWRCDEQGGVLLRLPFEDARHAPVAAIDQAKVIAAMLESAEPDGSQIYPLTGPVELNHHEIANTIADALGVSARYEPIGIEEF